MPSGWAAIPPPNAFVLKAGDPRLGGVLCGNCKGTGRVITLIFDSNCPMYVPLTSMLTFKLPWSR